MAEVFLTPTNEGAAVELSRTLYKKKILPVGSIDYKGRKINFDQAYLTDLATAYNDGAYDQVPFMLADATNAHTMDPERFRGECKGVEVADDGLWGFFDLSADAAAMVKANPKLGVSARIVEGYSRSDGKTYPRAMQHVLGTLDPRIPGLGAWTEVALSGYDSTDEVLDLTAAEFEGDGTVAKTDDGDLIDGLTREEYEALLASLDLDDDDTGNGDDGDNGGNDDGDDGDDGSDDNGSGAQRVPAGAGASLSNEGGNAIELANNEIRTLKVKMAADRFDADKREYVRKGVPPALVELARPVLESPDGFVLDFSNTGGEKVDAADVVRKLLDSSVGYIELARERGHSVDFSAEVDDDAKDEDAEALKMWAKMSGEKTD